MADPVNTGFDPLFGGPLRQLLERARAEGYNPNILSGVRDDNLQAQLVANAAATRAGQPLPYPEHGPVQKAAPVGYSPHESGTARDISGLPQGELARACLTNGTEHHSRRPGSCRAGELATDRHEPTAADAVVGNQSRQRPLTIGHECR